MSAADWELLAREGANYSNAVFDRLRERSDARAERAREDRERYQEGVARYEAWDACAGQTAIKDALLNELRRLDPTNPLCNGDLRTEIARRGQCEFVKNGRADVGDAAVVTRGIVRLR